jgi:hypothetical protein
MIFIFHLRQVSIIPVIKPLTGLDVESLKQHNHTQRAQYHNLAIKSPT